MNKADFTKFFPTDLSAAMPSLPFFPFDLKAVMDIQRKNLQAFSEAQHLVVESLQALAQRQAEIISQAVEDQTSLLREIIGDGSPEEKVAKQADRMKKNYEKSVANWRELSEMAQKSGQEAGDIVNDRIAASLGELKSSVAKKTAEVTVATTRAKAA